MLIHINDVDGTIIDELEMKNGKFILSKNDHHRIMRRKSYYMQKHIQRALTDIKIKRRMKSHRININSGKIYESKENYEGHTPVHFCGRFPIVETVSIYKNKNICSVGSVQKCGSVWACPVCASKILAERAKEIEKAVEYFKNEKKWLVTYTASHSKKTDLKRFAELFRMARADLSRLKKFRKFRKDASGYINSAEITYSFKNGWHWHIHELWFNCERPEFSKEWLKCLNKYGLIANIKNGYNVKESYDCAEYISKTGIETPRTWNTGKEMATTSKGKSIWDIADTNYKLVKEHYLATKGKRRITWSKGLKNLVNIKEKSDKELLKENGKIIIRIEKRTWSAIHSKNIISDILESFELFGLAYGIATMKLIEKNKYSKRIILKLRKARKQKGTKK